MDEPKSNRGGKRAGAGRPKNIPDAGLDTKFSKGFASRVFGRIKDLKLKASGQDGKPGAEIKTAEDYALDILGQRDAEGRAFFKLLLAYQLGKPVQPTMQADTRETAPPLDYGNLPRAFDKPPESRKPN